MLLVSFFSYLHIAFFPLSFLQVSGRDSLRVFGVPFAGKVNDF